MRRGARNGDAFRLILLPCTHQTAQCGTPCDIGIDLREQKPDLMLVAKAPLLHRVTLLPHTAERAREGRWGGGKEGGRERRGASRLKE